MLEPEQAEELKAAGLDYYNHNLDTSAGYYDKIITTRTYQDRLDTLQAVRDAGIKVCCGGILGMGESKSDRAELLHTLATLPQHPDSVPINQLVQVAGTPLFGSAPLDPLDFVRTIAVARILMPKAHVRLSAGRSEMSDELQALCFLAGANSIFYGEVVSTRTYQDRLDTLNHVRAAGIQVCCGGIVGMGETVAHRAGLLAELANLSPYPESVPINSLVRVPGTPLGDAPPIDPIDFVRVIATARILMPKARVRLSAGRKELGEAVETLCFVAGANSIFYGDKLLVTGNPDTDADKDLIRKLGLKT
jgi:biotin synthase-like enzyme